MINKPLTNAAFSDICIHDSIHSYPIQLTGEPEPTLADITAANCKPQRDQQIFTLTFTPNQNSFNLRWMFLECGMKLKSQADTFPKTGTGGVMPSTESRYNTMGRASAATVGSTLLQSRIRSSSNPDIPAPHSLTEDAEVRHILAAKVCPRWEWVSHKSHFLPHVNSFKPVSKSCITLLSSHLNAQPTSLAFMVL